MKHLLSFLLLSAMLTTCGEKDLPYEVVELKLELPATFAPAKDTISLGDTLLFTMDS